MHYESLPSLLYCGLASHKIPLCRGTSSSTRFPSQEPTIATDPDQDESGTHHPTVLPWYPYWYDSSICLISKYRHFAAELPTRILHAFLISPCLLHASPTHLCCMRLKDIQIGREWRVWFFFLLLKYQMIYAFVPICTVFVLAYQMHARRSQNVLLSESLYSDFLMLKKCFKMSCR